MYSLQESQGRPKKAHMNIDAEAAVPSAGAAASSSAPFTYLPAGTNKAIAQALASGGSTNSIRSKIDKV